MKTILKAPTSITKKALKLASCLLVVNQAKPISFFRSPSTLPEEVQVLLMEAAIKSDIQDGTTKRLNYLLKQEGFNAQSFVYTSKEGSRSPLHIAAMFGADKIVNLLLRYKALPQLHFNSTTPLSVALLILKNSCAKKLIMAEYYPNKTELEVDRQYVKTIEQLLPYEKNKDNKVIYAEFLETYRNKIQAMSISESAQSEALSSMSAEVDDDEDGIEELTRAITRLSLSQPRSLE